MIQTLLVANRGEVAGRIISTCRRMGIQTVAVYSEADSGAVHVKLADQAVLLGPAAPSQSYLNIDAVLQAARVTGADAVHPGYGFLAENAEFARRVREAGLVFVGPTAEVIEQMGSKVAARKLCQEAGVPTVPGSGALQDNALVEWAQKHGFPVMLKASAGGGGKGMRFLNSLEELQSALGAARREAEKAFGSDEVYLEKAIVEPRHLEVQIVGDEHGNVLHLGVRECSLQRRHQKIVEESPPAKATPELLKGLTDSAVSLAKSVGYTSLGTVEFLVKDDAYYFLEMNTRLQVEHPVTEMITGLDLVELQLNLIDGEPLRLSQEEVLFRGHAIEARLTCEDPYNNFLPAIGTVADWDPCPLSRVDACLERGSEVTPHYDSMVAKIISWADTRPKALRKLGRSLSRTRLLGVQHNLDYLVRLLQHPQVVSGDQHTNLVESLNLTRPETTAKQLLAAAATYWISHAGQRNSTLTVLPVEIQFEEEAEVWVCGNTYKIGNVEYCVQAEPGALVVDGHRFPVRASGSGDRWWIHTFEGTRAFKPLPRLPVPQLQGAAGTLTAPMPGSVVEVLVSEGDEVKAGQPLLKMEAMKMEQTITSPSDGRVGQVYFRPGDQVEAGATLLALEVEDAQP